MFGGFVLFLAIIIVFHTAFSTYEHLSHLKALGKPEGALPQDVILEAVVGLVLGILGAALNAPPLKGITWASEMRKRSVDEMDTRAGFASYVNRGRYIFSPTSS
ncbi:hypothetical protein E1B28_007280 [Marasmius oreades]|uniref:Membrane magnesium transporter n=1 Tax=Marasmius oreades TaxID=181124 RepID=A0A9P7UUR8_9AGAR|nr:uncharacterized protein E1B28_007280 [Marasmius oreades]KAG7093616.1 hypothetical protein E1B28_007280 [Marasmius oreades]